MARVDYTEEKRAEVLDLMRSGFSQKEIAETTGVSENTIRRWRNLDAQNQKRGYAPGEINKSLLELCGDNDITPYIGKEITKMTVREIITFLRLLGVRGKLTIEQTLKV